VIGIDCRNSAKYQKVPVSKTWQFNNEKFATLLQDFTDSPKAIIQ
jgi:hypothetical protein